MSSPGPHRLEVRRTSGGYEFWQGHCGRCAACKAGLAAWCTSYADSGSADEDRWRTIDAHLPADLDPEVCSAVATVLDVLSQCDQDDPCVLVIGLQDLGAATASVLIAGGVNALSESGPQPTTLSADVRAELASRSGSGRADVIVTFGPDLAAISRWVRRGGVVAAAGPTTAQPAEEGPALDTIAIREVTVRPVRSPHLQLPRVSPR